MGTATPQHAVFHMRPLDTVCYNNFAGQLTDFYGRSKVQRGLAWLAASGLEKENAVMVGDTDHDLEVANALGIRCVLFSGGHQPREKLAATGAPVIDDLRSLLDM